MDTYRRDGQFGAMVEYPPHHGPFNGFPPYQGQGADYPSSPHGYMPQSFATPPPGAMFFFPPPPTSPGGAPASPQSPMYSSRPFSSGTPPMYNPAGFMPGMPARPEFVGHGPEDMRARRNRDSEPRESRERDAGRERERRRSREREGTRDRDPSKRVSGGPFSGLMMGGSMGGSMDAGRSPSVVRRATQRAVASLERCVLSDLRSDEQECPICNEQMIERKYSANVPGQEHPLRMPCGHVFGAGCLKKHMSTAFNCPVCNYELPWEEKVPRDMMRERRPSMRSDNSRSSRHSDDFKGLPVANGPPPRPQTTRVSGGPFAPPAHYGNGPDPRVRPMTGFQPAQQHPAANRVRPPHHQHARFSSYGAPPPQGGPPVAYRHNSGLDPLHRPNSAATTQSDPLLYRFPPPLQLTNGPPSGSSRPEPPCGFKEMGLCENQSPESRVLRLDCNHAYHWDCLKNNYSSAGRGALNLREVWCDKCRKWTGSDREG